MSMMQRAFGEAPTTLIDASTTNTAGVNTDGTLTYGGPTLTGGVKGKYITFVATSPCNGSFDLQGAVVPGVVTGAFSGLATGAQLHGLKNITLTAGTGIVYFFN